MKYVVVHIRSLPQSGNREKQKKGTPKTLACLRGTNFPLGGKLGRKTTLNPTKTLYPPPPQGQPNPRNTISKLAKMTLQNEHFLRGLGWLWAVTLVRYKCNNYTKYSCLPHQILVFPHTTYTPCSPFSDPLAPTSSARGVIFHNSDRSRSTVLQWIRRFKSTQDKSIRDVRAVNAACPAYTKN